MRPYRILYNREVENLVPDYTSCLEKEEEKSFNCRDIIRFKKYNLIYKNINFAFSRLSDYEAYRLEIFFANEFSFGYLFPLKVRDSWKIADYIEQQFQNFTKFLNKNLEDFKQIPFYPKDLKNIKDFENICEESFKRTFEFFAADYLITSYDKFFIELYKTVCLEKIQEIENIINGVNTNFEDYVKFYDWNEFIVDDYENFSIQNFFEMLFNSFSKSNKHYRIYYKILIVLLYSTINPRHATSNIFSIKLTDLIYNKKDLEYLYEMIYSKKQGDKITLIDYLFSAFINQYDYFINMKEKSIGSET